MGPQQQPQQNIPTSLNNPGDLRFVGQTNATQSSKGFAEFPTPGDGYAALLNDVQSKINSHPDWTLADFSNVYAPADDGNNPGQYAAKLANQLGVAPNAKIGTLEPEIGKFAEAISQNEGYQGKSGGISPALAVGGGLAAAGAAAAGTAAAPAVLAGLGELGGGAIGSLLAGGEGVLSTIGEGVGSAIGLKTAGALAGGQQQGSYTTPTQPSDTYQNILNSLNSTVGGQATLKEGQNRGIDPASVLEQSGVLAHLQPDENGNYNKNAATDYLNQLISQDSGYVKDAVNGMTSPTNLDDLKTAAMAIAEKESADTGDLQKKKKAIDDYFEDAMSAQPTKVDKNGKEYVSRFIAPNRVLKKMHNLKDQEKDYARPKYERGAATYIRQAMRERLSQAAKQEGVQGFDETYKRMESHIIGRKAIKHLPKKAPRDKFKEFKKDLVAALAGAGVAKISKGNPLIGGIVGHLIERNLSRKEYQQLGKDFEREKAKGKAEKPLESLLSRKEKVKK